MKTILAIGTLVGCLAISVGLQAGEPAAPTPMMSGSQAQGTNPHSGHQMPTQGGQGMMGGHMGGMSMNCPMHQNMGTMMTLMKDVMLVQDALLKGVSAAEKEALQAKLAEMIKNLDTMQTQPMQCPMMQRMQHSHQPAAAPAARGASEKTGTSAGGPVVRAFAKDPICGMDVDMDKAKAASRTSEFQGKAYYFCSDACKQQFDKDPKRYISARP